jgi:hypothetical protein
MLLLFWNQRAAGVGLITGVKWYHDPLYMPRFFCVGEQGMTFVNPYADPALSPECSYITHNTAFNDSTYYQGEVLAGATDGIFRLDWDIVKSVDCDLTDPTDISSHVLSSYTVASGLLSNHVLAIDGMDDYLVVLTSSGISWKKGTDPFISGITTSGVDVCLTGGPRTYLADGDTVRLKIGDVVDFTSWDAEYNVGREITDLWVNQYLGVDTIFCATVSGMVMIEGDNQYDFSNTLSGSLELTSVATEYDSGFNWGHAFTAASGIVNIINLKHKTVENTVTYEGKAVLGVDTQRIYSR